MTVSPRRIPCRICGEYTPEQMVYGTFRTGPRPGFLYDPQDLTTLYQDAQGTLPVYRPGMGLVDPPVGLMLDKGQGLELGPELAVNGAFDSDTLWSKNGTNTSISAGALRVSNADTSSSGVSRGGLLSVNKRYNVYYEIISISNGGITARIGSAGLGTTRTTPGSYTEIVQQSGDTTFRLYGNTIGQSFVVDNVSIREIKGYHAYQPTTTARPTLSGRYNLLIATETLSTQSVTTEATNYTLSFSGTGTVTLSGTATGTYSAGTRTITCTAGTLTCTVAGSVTRADLRRVTAQTMPAYQSVTDANTYDTTGFPLYLLRDLIDDELIVQAPGFSGQRIAADFDAVTSDAVTIAAGEYKPFGAVDAGPAECTQLLVVAAPSADEITVFERFAAEKGLLPGGV